MIEEAQSRGAVPCEYFADMPQTIVQTENAKLEDTYSAMLFEAQSDPEMLVLDYLHALIWSRTIQRFGDSLQLFFSRSWRRVLSSWGWGGA